MSSLCKVCGRAPHKFGCPGHEIDEHLGRIFDTMKAENDPQFRQFVQFLSSHESNH